MEIDSFKRILSTDAFESKGDSGRGRLLGLETDDSSRVLVL